MFLQLFLQYRKTSTFLHAVFPVLETRTPEKVAVQNHTELLQNVPLRWTQISTQEKQQKIL